MHNEKGLPPSGIPPGQQMGEPGRTMAKRDRQALQAPTLFLALKGGLGGG